MSLTTRDVKVHAEAGSSEARGTCDKVPSRLASGAAPSGMGWAQRLAQLSQGAWGAALVRTASVALTLVGLAAIGSASFAQSSAHAPAQANMLQANLLSVAGAAATAANALAQGSATSSLPSEHDSSQQPQANNAGTSSTNDAKAAGSAAPTPTAPASGSPSEPGMTADGKIILNTATAAQFDKLPSVGMKRAEQIVALRERLGRFKSLNDLLRIKGIGVRTLKKMLPMLVLDPPKEPEPTKDQPPPTKD
ncbi:MAG TPA: helix-hairpin-helix domain-containing protein [Polyangiaceae bacterium]|nr:helix-hairpin-helix domain-containing protein [Polyangiaceae bacterium]